MSKVVCPGSFNPVTLGHLDVFERCARLFEEVVVLVSYNSRKRYDVSSDQRVEWIRRAVSHLPNVTVESHGGLLADFVKSCAADMIVKGVRNANDVLVESQMYFANRELLRGGADTLFLPTCETFCYMSSSLVRDIASHGGDISTFVPASIAHEVADAYRPGR